MGQASRFLFGRVSHDIGLAFLHNMIDSGQCLAVFFIENVFLGIFLRLIR